jgi:dUTP pyrophosphatase
MQQYTLLVKPLNEEIAGYYKNHSSFHPGDSGYDLFVAEDVEFKLLETKFVDLKIQCEMLAPEGHNVSYYLYPRSSISKTPLMLCNSVGIIDAGYRENIIAALKYMPNPDDLNFDDKLDKNAKYVLKKGTRIAQICSPTLTSLNHQIVDTLSETKRGSGGFGSTGQ